MKTTIILGAGATRGASTVNPQVVPPLLGDLPGIVSSKLLSLNQSPDGPEFAKGFNDLLDLTETRNDVETYLTVLHILGLISREINPDLVFINDNEIKEVLEGSILQNRFDEIRLEKIARKILEYFLSNKKMVLVNCPFNFQSLFQSSLREYMHHSLTNCFCRYHEKLFARLKEDDYVVNFNYDEVGDFTLFAMNRLSRLSFDGLPFAKIEFPKNVSSDCISIKYLKVHGSFSWSTDINRPDIVCCNLISQASDKKMIGNTFFPIILPTLTKELIYMQYPIFASHIKEFSKSLEDPDIIYLVGKSFLNSDYMLNKMIGRQRSKTRCHLIIIDPNCTDSDFVDYHQNLFNGKCVEQFLKLEDYFHEKRFG